MPRPQTDDHRHNQQVGLALHSFIIDLYDKGASADEMEQQVGFSVNAVAQAAYDLGRYEGAVPSQN